MFQVASRIERESRQRDLWSWTRVTTMDDIAQRYTLYYGAAAMYTGTMEECNAWLLMSVGNAYRVQEIGTFDSK